jgi:hypothetical protein
MKFALILFLCISSKVQPYFFKEGSSSTACLHQYWEGMCTRGGMGRRSVEALTEKIATAKTPTTTPAIAVLRFHCGGLLHQPPAGDQTYFDIHRRKKLERTTNDDNILCEHIIHETAQTTRTQSKIISNNLRNIKPTTTTHDKFSTRYR